MEHDATRPSWMTDEHELYADSCRQFFEAELVPHIESWRKSGMVDRGFWNKAGEAGLLGATLPEEYGGGGAPMSFDAVTVLEHARTGDSGWGIAIQSIVAHYIVNYGTEDQKQRWLPKLASGEWVSALAMTEPGTGSDLQAITTSAERDGDHYVMNGSKTFITNGQAADFVLVAAMTTKGEGAKGMSMIGVEAASAGFRKGRNLEKLGMKGQDTSELFFENVRVPVGDLLGGEEGQGFYQMMKQLPWERLSIGVTALGRMDFVLKETVEYTQQRKAFGKRLYDLQNTRFKLAEAKTKIEVTRSFVHDCIGRLDAGALDASTASMAKWWGSQQECEVADECLQLFGGYGYMLEYPVASAFADARVQKIYGGANEIMKELIARSMDQ